MHAEVEENASDRSPQRWSKSCIMVLKETICTGICLKLKRYKFKSIFCIFCIASASLRKIFGLPKCFCLSNTEGFSGTEDLECLNEENPWLRQD